MMKRLIVESSRSIVVGRAWCRNFERRHTRYSLDTELRNHVVRCLSACL